MKTTSSASPLLHLFDFENKPPSLDNLDQSITMNSITKTPIFRYRGTDASANGWLPWGYGEHLLYCDGTRGYNQPSCLFGKSDVGLKFNGDGYYQAPTIDSFSETHACFVCEMVIKFYNTGTFCTTAKPPSYSGDSFGLDTDRKFNYYVGAVWPKTDHVLEFDTFYHIMTFRSDTLHAPFGVPAWIFINGELDGYIAQSGIGQSYSAPLELGAYSSGADYSQNILYYISYWRHTTVGEDAWFLPSHESIITNIAQTRFAQLTGTYPKQARGTQAPSVMTRDSYGYLEKIESDGTIRLYKVGQNWPRISETLDENGRRIRGYVSEHAIRNLRKYSEDFENAYWLNYNDQITITANDQTAPDGTASRADKLVFPDGASIDNSIGLNEDTGFALGNKTITFSIYMKRISGGTQINMGMTDGNSFDPGAAYSITHTLTNDWRRYSLSCYYYNCGANKINCFVTTNGLPSTPATEDLGTITVAMWGWQVEEGPIATSYIRSSTTHGYRDKDVLRFIGDDGNMASEGTIMFDTFIPQTSGTKGPDYDAYDGYFLSINNSGSSNNVIQIYRKDDVIRASSMSDSSRQYYLTGTSEVDVGKVRHVEHNWTIKNAELSINNIEQSPKWFTQPAAATKAYRWKMQESSGNLIDDMSGDNATLQVYGTPVYGTETNLPTATGFNRNVIRTIGSTTNRAYFKDSGTIVGDQTTNSFSVSFVLKYLSEWGVGKGIVNKCEPGGTGAYWGITMELCNRLYIGCSDAANNIVFGYINPNVNNRFQNRITYFTVNFDRTNNIAYCFVDGQSENLNVDMSAIAGNSLSNNQPLKIGSNPDDSYYPNINNGCISDVMIANGLTTLEEHQLWYRTFYNYISNTTIPTGLNRINIGSDESAAKQGGLISNLKIYGKYNRK